MTPFITEAEAQEFLERRERDKSTCRYCGEKTFWASLYGDRRIPMDWEPTDKGRYNLTVTQHRGERIIFAADNFKDKGTHNRHVCPEVEVRFGTQPLKTHFGSRKDIQEHYT